MGGVIVVLMLVFSLWVRSVPSKAPATQLEMDHLQSRPEDDPALKVALMEAEEALKQAQEAGTPGFVDQADASAGETIEL